MGAATKDEWDAFCALGDLTEIASPRFARLVAYAHAEGLLAPMLADDPAAAQKRASELSASLSARIHSEYRITPISPSKSVADHSADPASPGARLDTVLTLDHSHRADSKMADVAHDPRDEIEITSEMIEAGEDALLSVLGGAVSSHWSAPDLAKRVFLAMCAASHQANEIH